MFLLMLLEREIPCWEV